ncbi:hypothetical protein PoB_003814500 [Plakobranchus ocellatus]|uniref:Uncharacterized protein n=1 Tax=Plakobranchus ocellatus TaxID=259542 RepID=A0AAV4AXV7_9GAST|nr:hypothetical protein PoB_003814500 [Plakobranchus ocellatus]
MFHRQRKRQLLRRVIAKFRDNVRKKRAQREADENQNEPSGTGMVRIGNNTSKMVQSSIARFKRNHDPSGSAKEEIKMDTKPEGSHDFQKHIPDGDKHSPHSQSIGESNSISIDQINADSGAANRATVTTPSKSIHSSTKSPDPSVKGKLTPSPVVTLETIKLQRVLPPIGSSIDGKPTNETRDLNNPLITQTHTISRVTRETTPKDATSSRHGRHSPCFSHTPYGRTLITDILGDKSANYGENQFRQCDSKVDTGTSNVGSTIANSFRGPCETNNTALADFNERDNSRHTLLEAELVEPRLEGRSRNLVRKLKKEKERRMLERAEILDRETIVRYSRKPYHDVTPMYGQPRRLQFIPPSRKLHHEQEKLIRAEQSVELERQVKINNFFNDLFKPKDDERWKFVKKDDEAEKPKKATLSLAGVLSGLFSLELSEAPKGKQTLQDKFRRLQSCQYLRVYQPRRGSDQDDHRVTSWDAAERYLKSGLGAFGVDKQ